jgi:hypothetical protein
VLTEAVSVSVIPYPAVTVAVDRGDEPFTVEDMVVSLDDLWGRDAARTQERLRAAGSWDDRFESTKSPSCGGRW